jgi:hypothetical protein
MNETERSHWYQYDGKAVFVQLREPYVGVTYPNMPVTKNGADGPEVVCIPFVRGVLRVKPSGYDDKILLTVRTTDPNPNNGDASVEIVMHAEDVLYVTHIDKKLISSLE